jgi:hypothetical protein
VVDVLEEVAGREPRRELVAADEVVVAPLPLAWPTLARRRRDRELELRELREEAALERALSGTRRAGDCEDEPCGPTG